MVQKLSKDVYFEIESLESKVDRLKKRLDSAGDHATLGGPSGVGGPNF